MLASLYTENLAVVDWNPRNTPSAPNDVAVIPMNGFAWLLPSSASNWITADPPLVPTLTVLCAYTSPENNISVATELNVAPKVAHSVVEEVPLDGGGFPPPEVCETLHNQYGLEEFVE